MQKDLNAMQTNKARAELMMDLLLVAFLIGFDVAASALLKGLTAHYLMTSVYAVQPGDTVLVHAGAGGVGLILTQWLAHRGARVITTVSTPAKAELSRQAGFPVWQVRVEARSPHDVVALAGYVAARGWQVSYSYMLFDPSSTQVFGGGGG